ncbi:MAG: hypothetical protein HKO72_05725 [Flavobacteriaceae bacterium]|nr:hypothetical protein [Bacteroidia bacterium]NNL60820.1 hypothetical protein [Flavobacteriaceae bacterium]
MKNSILLLATGLILLTGCSTEPISSQLQEDAMLIDNETDDRDPVFEISFQESGQVRMLPNGECDDLENVKLEGFTNQTVFGKFTTNTRMCTDFQDIYNLKGAHTLPNGDRINFTVDSWMVEGVYIKFVYTYDGGSGAFDGATGELVILHRMFELEDSRGMTYINIANGHIRLASN